VKDPIEAWLLYGVVARDILEFDEAIKAFNYVRDKEPDSPRSWLEIAYTHEEHGDIVAAKKIIEEAFDVSAKNSDPTVSVKFDQELRTYYNFIISELKKKETSELIKVENTDE
jgi:tetratricopeptide (TPR) repeat protein